MSEWYKNKVGISSVSDYLYTHSFWNWFFFKNNDGWSM